MKLQDPQLRQRGRASIDFLALIAGGSMKVRAAMDSEMADAGVTADILPVDMDARYDAVGQALGSSRSYATLNLLGDWHGRMHGPIAVEAFEDIAADLKPAMDAAETGAARLTLNPDQVAPDYWEGVEFHRTALAWDRYDNMGFVHGEIIHKKMVDRMYPGGIFRQRRAVADMAPRASYERILDMGCSSGHFTTALAAAYPAAKITGVDLSRRMLEHAWRTANANGWDWDLYQRPAEETGFDDASFDLVASYIMLHEMPAKAIRASFVEALRLLAPGGDMVMSDVTRYADLDKLSAWKADRNAKYGGEPHWRASASLDLAELAAEVGFVEVKAEGLYPHVLIARKPA
jgi:2-polyprenyl-3-methyl-5-hydroxy-6-metoxy-1,4-benzoquinol methylase